jgi:hypothetical protein
MSLLCGKNPALEALKSVQDSIKTALASKKAGLATLTAKLAEAKSKAESLVASLPNLSSFQAELAALAGATPEQIAQFKAKWDGKVAELDSLVSKVTGTISDLANLDFCKDVPNVKMDPATGDTVEEAKEAPTPNVAPAKAEPVEPTVVVKSETVTSGKSEVVPVTAQTEYDELVSRPYRQTVYVPLVRIQERAQETWNDLRRIIVKENSSRVSIFGSGRHERADELNLLEQKAAAAATTLNLTVRYHDTLYSAIYKGVEGTIDDSAPDIFVDAELAKMDPKIKPYVEQDYPPLEWVKKVHSILMDNAKVVENLAAYRKNRASS